MSNNLVNGFSDIQSRYNLVANGSFIINQRGNFGSFTPVKINDYVCDMWYVTFNDIDYVEAKWNNGSISLRGHGKKGQRIDITNREKESLGFAGEFDSLNRYPITAVGVLGNSSLSIPVVLNMSPKYYSVNRELLYRSQPVIKPGERKQTIEVVNSGYSSSLSRGHFRPYLMADGEFEFTLYSCRWFGGAFRNPPGVAPVPYAEDMQRCERYYQVGEWTGMVPMVYTGVYLYSYINTPFKTKMSGSPSVSVSSLDIDLYQDAALGNNATLVDESNWSPQAASDITTNKFRAVLRRTGTVADRSTIYAGFNWVAEV